ncbi:hypothetical protein [Rhodococcus erythropolis]|uniref:hypothetical protein n=1 Tax=Rhodococcus erythropolis TaxID=1833 RepID=UPI001BE6DD59|nr:hypothetical protein [Rhodococcus erythropolis]MBT2268804.1 hypothetical protein [Rhodococcus erythropolis]
MNGHSGRLLVDCPECAKVDGWQTATGLRFAAQNIRHEAETEADIDLAELCQWTVDTHYPDPKNNNHCVACGERWYQDVNIGPLQCLAFIEVRIQNNFWVMRKVWKIREKWKAHL